MNLDWNVLYGIGLSTLLLFGGHYWRRFLDREFEIQTPALACYAYGTASLWLGAALWLSLGGLMWIAWGILAIDLMAGLLVVLLYAADAWLHSKKQESRQQKVDLVERLAGERGEIA